MEHACNAAEEITLDGTWIPCSNPATCSITLSDGSLVWYCAECYDWMMNSLSTDTSDVGHELYRRNRCTF